MKKIFILVALAFATAITVKGSTVATDAVFNTNVEKFSAIDNAMITPVVISDYNFDGNGFSKISNILPTKTRRGFPSALACF
jgi:hypothetical protein